MTSRKVSQYSNCVSGTVHPYDDFAPARTHLRQLYSASLNQNPLVHNLALKKQHFVSDKGLVSGTHEDFSAFLR
jgi:hypothetical protein